MVKMCPLKGVLGDFVKEEPAPEGAEGEEPAAAEQAAAEE